MEALSKILFLYKKPSVFVFYAAYTFANRNASRAANNGKRPRGSRLLRSFPLVVARLAVTPNRLYAPLRVSMFLRWFDSLFVLINAIGWDCITCQGYPFLCFRQFWFFERSHNLEKDFFFEMYFIRSASETPLFSKDVFAASDRFLFKSQDLIVKCKLKQFYFI